MKSTEKIRQYHRAATYLKAFLRKQPNDTIQLMRLSILVSHYEDMLNCLKPDNKDILKQEAA